MRNRVTVIMPDNIIIVDNAALQFDFTKPANIHAIQWHEGTGHVEYTDGQDNKDAVYAEDIAPYVTLWEAEKQKLEAIANTPPTLEEAKAAALIELTKANTAAENGGYIQLPSGIRVDARRTDLENIKGLISLAEKGLLPMPISFRDYDNNQQDVSLEVLHTMQTLIEVRGIELYARKWELEALINTATTVEEVLAIDVYAAWPGMD